MSKKKRKKGKKLTITQIKEKIWQLSSAEMIAKKLGFQALKDKTPSAIDAKDKAKRKAKKHKKDYAFDREE